MQRSFSMISPQKRKPVDALYQVSINVYALKGLRAWFALFMPGMANKPTVHTHAADRTTRGFSAVSNVVNR